MKPVSLLSAFLFISLGANAANNAKQIDPTQLLKDVQGKLFVPKEQVKVKMVVREANGQSRDRLVIIKRFSEDDTSAVKVKLMSPADVRGVAYLSKWSGEREEQWLYAPSQNKIRRIVAGNRSQKFLDTEFNLDDFSADTYRNFENRIVKEEQGGKVLVIKSASKEAESIYQRVLTWVDIKKMRVEKAEYYDKDGNLLKVVQFKEYQKFGDTVRPKYIEVKNVQNHRSTQLQMAGFKAISSLNKGDFSPTSLGED